MNNFIYTCFLPIASCFQIPLRTRSSYILLEFLKTIFQQKFEIITFLLALHNEIVSGLFINEHTFYKLCIIYQHTFYRLVYISPLFPFSILFIKLTYILLLVWPFYDKHSKFLNFFFTFSPLFRLVNLGKPDLYLRWQRWVSLYYQ